MPVYLDLATRLDRDSAEKAAKDVLDKFVDAANDINKNVGGILSKMFDGIDGSKARAEAKSMQDEYANLARAAGDSERAMVSSAGNVEVAIKRLHEAHDKYGAQASQTAAAENRVVDAWARSGRAAVDAAAATDLASAAHGRLEQASGGAAGAAEGMSSSMLLAAGGVVAVGAAAVEAGKKLYDMGEQWADMSDKITFATGKIGADADAMVDRIAAIGDKTAAPLGNIADVYTQLGRLKDLQGATLDDLTKQVSDYDQMAKQAGSDPLNLGSYTRVMQEFHVPAAQVGADLDILKGAADSGRVPLNELIQTLQTAGPSADIAGLSFAQTANVLATLDESGVNADNALKGFRMALGNIATDSPALQKQIKFGPDENELQRLKDVIQKIQDLHQSGNDIGAIDLGKTVFGRSWADIGEAILDDKLNVDTLNTSIEDIGPGIEAQRTATEHFGDTWQLVKNQISDALKPLSTDVFQGLDDGLKQLGDWVASHGDGVNQFFTTMATTLATLNPGTEIANALSWNAQDGFWTNLGNDVASLNPLTGIANSIWPDADSGDGHTGESGRAHRGGSSPADTGAPAPTGKPQPGNPTSGAPTTPDINTAAPYHPLDLNPADKPPGAETYDEWISSQKAVQSALNRQADTGEQLAKAQKRQADLLDSGKATQEELNSASEDINKAQRDNLQSTQDLTVAQQKYVEDANKAAKGKRGDDPLGADYDPFKESTKNNKGLIPQLASLFAASAVNQALGNPYGKLQAAKRGEDPSNPLYVNDVSADSANSGGIPGVFGRFFQRDAVAQAAQSPAAPGGLAPSNAPAGSIPQMVPPGQPSAASSGAPSGGPPGPELSASVSSGPVPTGGNATRDKNALDIITQAKAMGFSKEQTLAALGVGLQETGLGTNPRTSVVQNQNGTAGITGEFQQDGGYAKYGDRQNNPSDAAKGFLTEFAKRGKGLNDPNPWHHAVSDVQVPAAAGAGGYNDATGDYLKNLQRGAALDYYNRLAGPDASAPPAAAPAPAPGGLRGFFQQLLGNPPPVAAGPPIPHFATGGPVASSDTVPAMLTPNEFVVNRDAAQKNLPALQAMNSGQAPPADPHMPTPTRQASASSSVSPPPPGPRVGQGTGSGFGIGGGLIGLAETAAIDAAIMSAGAGMATGGVVGMADGGGVPNMTAPAAPASAGAGDGSAGGGSTGGGGGSPAGGGGDPMTAAANRTVGYVGQLAGIGVQGLMSSLIPGASQSGGVSSGIIGKLAGSVAGAHPSAPNSAGKTATPLDSPSKQGQGYATGGTVADDGGDTNHIAQQTNGVHIDHMTVQNGQSGQDVANQLAFQSYAGYGGR